MKFFFISAIITLLLHYGGISHAQTNVYHPFPDSGAVWRVDLVRWDNPFGTNYLSAYQYELGNDTLINGVPYTKLIRSGWFNNSGFPIYESWFYMGAIRQDTSQKKVYFLDGSLGTLSVLYDFSLQIGDTIPPPLLGQCPYKIITSIDSIQIGSSYRKKINLMNGCGFPMNYAFLIEGIGSTKGLIEMLDPFESSSQLVCFSIDGITLYPDTNTACPIFTTVENIEHDNKVLVHPNPVKRGGQLYLTLRASKTYTIQFYNVMGVLVYEVATDDNTIRLNDNLISGIYFYRITGIDDSHFSGKLVVCD